MSDSVLQPVWNSDIPWDTTAASHLLRRAGFGGREDEVKALVAMGPQKAIASFIKYQDLPDTAPNIQFGDLTAPEMAKKKAGGTPNLARAQLYKAMSQDQRRVLNNLTQDAQRQKMDEIKYWWLARMVATKRPLEEKMTLFWHGLLVSSAVTVQNPYLLYTQNQLFRKNATGNYRSLVQSVSKDPAMLVYLNNNENVKAHPNENYARELMELFTLGIGNYTEKDIKESARSFTGWSNQAEEFVFNKNQHDYTPKTFLGQTGNFTGEDIVNIIFQQPACATYIATRLLKFFAIDDPSADIVSKFAGLVRENNYEIAPVLNTLFSSRWFYSEEVVLRQIKSPVQLVVGALRQLNVPLTQPAQVNSALKLMGQDLFYSPTVKGWDGGRAWINTSTLFARYNLPAYLGTGRLPQTGKKPGGPDVRGQFTDFESGWNPQVDLAAANICTTDAAVDFYILKLFGQPLDTQKRNELIQYVNLTGDSSSHVNDPVDPESDRRIRSLVHLVMSMAEYQLC